jgi:lysophospholipase L1-like esterase
MPGLADPGEHWVGAWVAAPQLTEPENLPPAPFVEDGRVLAGATLRQTVRVSVGARQLRLLVSNAFGGCELPITGITVACPFRGRAGVSAIEPGSTRPVTFHGRARTVIPVGGQAVSDPVPFDLEPLANLAVTVFLAGGQASADITSHPGSRTTSYLLAGDHLDADDLPGATATDHWYFLTGVEVLSPRSTAAVVMLGDSLTDGRGSTTNANDRWPDRLLARLRSDPSTAQVAILNQGIGGNRVLHDGLGPHALARLDRDVFDQRGVRWLFVFEGTNDIGTAGASEAGQAEVVAALIAAYDQIVTRSHERGIRVYGATLPPFGGNPDYDDAAGLRDRARQEVNRWIRTGRRFDAVVDFDAVVRDPSDPRRVSPALHDGDWLHLNPLGYQALADVVPIRLFA